MDLKNIDDDAQYKVELNDRVELYGQMFYPGHDVILRGDVLKTVAKKVARAELVDHAEPV